MLADNDGDKIFSTFDTRDLDKSQPEMDCGTHIITGGTGKYRESPGVSHLLVSQCLHWLARRLFCDGHPAQHDLGDQMIKTSVSVLFT